MSSNTDTKTPITIEAPELNSANYGETIKQVFSNIDTNFKTLSNEGFIKGIQGDGIEHKEYSLFVNEDFTTLGQAISNKIKSHFYGETNPKTINNIEYDSYIKKIGTSIVGYYIKNNGEQNIEFTEPYIFYDLRWHPADTENPSKYNGELDCSCVIYVKTNPSNSQYEVSISESFPALYYKTTGDSNGFYWKINGIETAIPASGVEGPKGDTSQIWVATYKNTQQVGSNVKQISTILLQKSQQENSFEWKTPSDVSNWNDYLRKPLDGDTALVIESPTEQNTDKQGVFYITNFSIPTVGDLGMQIYANITDTNKINGLMDSDAFKKIMLNYKHTQSDLSEYFIPCNTSATTSNTKPRHTLFAEPPTQSNDILLSNLVFNYDTDSDSTVSNNSSFKVLNYKNLVLGNNPDMSFNIGDLIYSDNGNNGKKIGFFKKSNTSSSVNNCKFELNNNKTTFSIDNINCSDTISTKKLNVGPDNSNLIEIGDGLINMLSNVGLQTAVNASASEDQDIKTITYFPGSTWAELSSPLSLTSLIRINIQDIPVNSILTLNISIPTGKINNLSSNKAYLSHILLNIKSDSSTDINNIFWGEVSIKSRKSSNNEQYLIPLYALLKTNSSAEDGDFYWTTAIIQIIENGGVRLLDYKWNSTDFKDNIPESLFWPRYSDISDYSTTQS